MPSYTVKKGRLTARILGLAFAVMGGGFLAYNAFVAPQRGAEHFCEIWKQRLESISNPEDIPSQWAETVYCRRFSDGWILAAMHHGSCTQTGALAFNASIFRDSVGNIIVYPDYSPCAGGIRAMGAFWESLTPAATLHEYLSSFEDGPPKSG